MILSLFILTQQVLETLMNTKFLYCFPSPVGMNLEMAMLTLTTSDKTVPMDLFILRKMDYTIYNLGFQYVISRYNGLISKLLSNIHFF